MELSSFDYYYLVKEWQALVGGKVQKVYLKDRTHLIHVYNKGQWHLVFTDGAAFFTQSKIAWPQTPPGYGMFLRRRLSNARVTRVAQLGTDRIITIDFETKEGPVRFLVELIGECNSMFLRENSIVSALSTHNYADRTIRGGIPYIAPPARPAPEDVPDAVLLGKPAAKTFASEWSLGGKYSEELCARADIRKDDKLTENMLVAAREAFTMMREQPLAPVHSETEALPFPFLTKVGSDQWTKSETYNAAIDAIMTHKFSLAEHKESTSVDTQAVTKQEKILLAQRAHKEKIEREVVAKQREGELLYENYAELKTLLESMKADWKKLNLGQIRDKYGTHPLIRTINEDGTIEVELGE